MPLDSPWSTKTADNSPIEPLLTTLETNFCQNALKEINPILKNCIVEQDGKKITLLRQTVAHMPLQGDFLNGHFTIDSVQFGNISLTLDNKTKTASNIDGISINVTVFGEPQSLKIEQLQLTQDPNGQKTLNAEITNPMPEPALRLTGMPKTFKVQFPVLPEGKLGSPKLSKVFEDAAGSTGLSIGGLLAKDALSEASKVALFVESNPKWVSHVVQPVLHDIYNHLRPQRPLPGNTGINMGTNTQPTDATGQPTKPADVPAPVIDKPATPGDHKYTEVVNGVERTYHVHVPPSYNGKTPMPMVLLLHGHGQTGEEIARHTKMNELADREGFIAIYPDARAWAGRSDWRAWDTNNGLIPPGSHADDVGFLRKIIENTEKNLAIDPKRIFMAGLSNGGMMAFRAAGELSDKVAAIAVVSGAMSGIEPPPKLPISVLNIHGTEDEIVPYEGLKNVPASLTSVGLPKFKPMEYTTKFWTEQNKISNPPIVLRNGNVTERRFINTDTGAEVSEYTIHDGHHVPDNVEQLTGTIWNFLKSHPRATGTALDKPQDPPEAPFNITERLKSHMRARGMRGLEIDAGKMLNEVEYLRSGSFSPRNTFAQFEAKSGIKLNDGISEFLKNTSEVSKLDTRISIKLENPQEIPIGNSSPDGLIDLKSVTVKNSGFDLYVENNLPSLRNITGVTAELRAFGKDLSVGITEASQKLDGAGDPYYRIKADNPLPGWARFVMAADRQIPVEFKLGEYGNTTILNEREIKNATLGVNPITRGYIDVGTHAFNLYNRPSWGSGLHLAKDLGILGGTGYGAYRLAAMKLGMKGRIGVAVGATLFVAPAIIHGIERLID